MVCLTLYLCIDYYKDEDFSEIQIKTFHEDEQSVYPDVTVCFPNQYSNRKLEMYGDGINSSSYAKFLDGDLWDNRMVHIRYEDVSMRLSDILLEVCARSAFEERCQTSGAYTTMPLGGSTICFTFHISKIRMKSFGSFGLKISSSVFPNGVRPTRFINPHTGVAEGMMVWFHYRNQRFGSGKNLFAVWPLRRNDFSKTYGMHFQMKGLEMLQKRRNKRREPCSDKEVHDTERIESIIRSVGCRPTYWRRITNYPICTSKEDLKRILRYHREEILHSSKLKPDMIPCLTMVKVEVEYVEEEIYVSGRNEMKGDESWFFISIEYMTDTFKHIKQVPAISLLGLVGTIGGYVALILGLAILDIPSKLLAVFRLRRTSKGTEKTKSRKVKEGKESILLDVLKTTAIEPCTTV